ncbi:MAG: PAS domain-containing protein [Caldilineaceae bacterium]
MYRSLVESSDSTISLIDADGRYLYLNTIAAMPFGGDPDALVGKSVYDLFPAQEADDVLADVQWVIQSEKGMVLEPQVTIGDRTCWFRTSIQPVRDSDGVPYAALLHASDITERKLVEQEIHRQNAILQQSHDLIALSDLDGVITYINQGGADMAEVGDPQLILGRKLTDFHPPEDARRIMEVHPRSH